MKLRNIQRKMLKKAIKGHKKGALPFAIEQVESVGGGKTVILSQILEDIDAGKAYMVSHREPVRDWSLEPTIKKCVITVNKDVLAAGIVEPEDVFTIPLYSPALYVQCIGRIKRITPEQAQAELEANIKGPSMADLIKQGWLVPPPATFYLTDAKTGEKIEGSEFTSGKKDGDEIQPNPSTKDVEEFSVIWFESDQKWIAVFPTGVVLDNKFGAVGYATGAALDYLGRGEAEFDCLDDYGDFYRYAKCDEFWNEGAQA
jgi:hypothetical protein